MNPARPLLHRLARTGDLQGALALAESDGERMREELDAYDTNGFTPLMHAVSSPHAEVALVQALLRHGASVHQESRERFLPNCGVLALALRAGDPQKVSALLEAGADIHYRRAEGYDALIDAVHGRDVVRDARLIELLQLLTDRRVALDGVTTYGESGVRVLSRLGRYDAVRLLLDAGADEAHLEWPPLVRAVAIGDAADVAAGIANGAALEDKDWWEQTAWLVAIQTGDLAKARLLLAHGADANARGRCAKPPLHYAIESHRAPMLRWLLGIGQDVEQTDQFGSTPLMEAVEADNAEAVDILLQAGAEVDRERRGQTALSHARTREIATRLLAAGADPRFVTSEGRRALLGFDPEPDADLLDVSSEEFNEGRSRRYGSSNPEPMRQPFWEGMIRAGIDAYQAKIMYMEPSSLPGTPVWCAQRFGQSMTFLPDGRIVQIAGEHEDSYDPDFCIYNDVFVHDPDGTIHIYSYPEADFPPTDFHTASLVGDSIYVIGSLGYLGSRRHAETPIYRLDLATFRMERLETRGENPGWIYRHRAVHAAPHEIRISGGTVVTPEGNDEAHVANERVFVLDTRQLVWRVLN